MLKENKNYDAWLHWNITFKCNLKCIYCFNNLPSYKEANIVFEKKNRRFGLITKLAKMFGMRVHDSARAFYFLNQKHKKIPAIRISAMLKSLDRTNKIFLISFTGGEPFLVPNIVEACVKITEKHYISFNSNLTSAKIRKFAEVIKPDKVVSIIASFHIKELERSGLVGSYIDNFLICREKGFNIIADAVAYPPLLSEIRKYRAVFEKNGIKINFSRFAGLYNGKSYPESYSEEELDLFGLDKTCRVVSEQREKICNAGYNAAVVLPEGAIQPCYRIRKNIGNIYGKIGLNNNMVTCPFDSCVCPLKVYDPYLFEKALSSRIK